MVKFLAFALIVALTCGKAIAEQKVHKCYCDVPIQKRTPCPAGGHLGEEDCLKNYCCYVEEKSDGAHKCYERKFKCDDHVCNVQRNRRVPCGWWQLGESHCRRLNCCYDRAIFPYCFRKKDISRTPDPIEKIKEDDIIKIVATTTTTPPENMEDPTEAVVVTTKPQITRGPEKFAKCKPSQRKCNGSFLNRTRCLALGCCWQDSNKVSKCWQPRASPEMLVKKDDDLRCWTCENAKSNSECLKKGKSQKCGKGKFTCQVEIRRRLSGIHITKRCKQAHACDNNNIQNLNSFYDPRQCNKNFSVSVCRCCCKTNDCNKNTLNCQEKEAKE